METKPCINFSETWWYSNYGFEFDEAYHFNPILRTVQEMKMEKVLFERFGDISLGEKDPKPYPHPGMYGHRFMSVLFGSKILYQKNQAPAVYPVNMDEEDMQALCVPELDTALPVKEFIRQSEVLTREFGFCDASINFGGPLNVALSVLGENAFINLAVPSKGFLNFLDVITQTIIKLYDELVCRFSPEKHRSDRRTFFIGNCPVPMISPSSYEEIILPYDLFLRRNAYELGLHHCGVMDNYLKSYQLLCPLSGGIDVGWGSNIVKVREAFPDTKLRLMINCYDVARMPEMQLQETMQKMVADALPAELISGIWLADIGPDFPDWLVRSFAKAWFDVISVRSAISR